MIKALENVRCINEEKRLYVLHKDSAYESFDIPFFTLPEDCDAFLIEIVPHKNISKVKVTYGTVYTMIGYGSYGLAEITRNSTDTTPISLLLKTPIQGVSGFRIRCDGDTNADYPVTISITKIIEN